MREYQSTKTITQEHEVNNNPFAQKKRKKVEKREEEEGGGRGGTRVSIPDDRSGVDGARQELIATLTPLQRKDRTYHDDKALKNNKIKELK